MQKGISEKGQQCLKKAFKVVPYNDKQVTLWEVKSYQQNILSKDLKTCWQGFKVRLMGIL
jgi:hypothetical protein